jgi:6-phosphogluconolactonase (cycloisomerase 2 family)
LDVPVPSLRGRPRALRPRRSPGLRRRGGLTQPDGAEGCVNAEGDLGCKKGRGFEYGAAVAIAPDGRHVYSVSTNGAYGAITAFGRDETTGALTQLAGEAGCVTSEGRGGCAKATGLALVNDITISPDGRTVYTVSYAGYSGGQAVDVFRRNPRTGTLRQLQCLSAFKGEKGCDRAPIQYPYAVAVAGEKLVVAGEALSVFKLAGNGTIKGTGTCLRTLSKQPEGLCSSAPRDNTRLPIDELTVAAGVVYATASGSGSQIQTYSARNLKPRRCLGTDCDDARGIEGATDVAADADGVYVSAYRFIVTNEENGRGYTRSSAIGVFRAEGLTQLEGGAGCVLFAQKRGPDSTCSGAPAEHPDGFFNAQSVALTPDGKYVLASFSGSAAIVLLERDPRTQALTMVPGLGGCLGPKPRRAEPGCVPQHGIDFANDVVVAKDGRNAYVVTDRGLATVGITD